jgi:preprotein translocase subunit SecG
VFVLLSIVLAALAVDVTGGREIDTSLERGGTAPAQQPAPVDPLAGAAGAGALPAAPDSGVAGAPAPADDPLTGAASQ